jgi:hypothetical protein
MGTIFYNMLPKCLAEVWVLRRTFYWPGSDSTQPGFRSAFLRSLQEALRAGEQLFCQDAHEVQ